MDDYIKRNWHIIALAIITLCGFFLRLYNLDWQCLKVDENVTKWAAMQTTDAILHWSLSVDYNPPLYYLLAHWSTMVFGEVTRFSIRFPALICGTLAIPASYYLGREIRGNTLGLLVASLVAIMFPFFYYSQDARAYPLVLVFFLCYAYFAVKIYKGTDDIKIILFASVFAALCLWSHYYSALSIALITMFTIRKHFNNTLTFSFITTILIFPMVMLFDFSQFAARTDHRVFNVFWSTPDFVAIMLANEMLCWSWIVILPLFVYSLYKYRNPILQMFGVVSITTAVFLIPMSAVTAVMPRYAIIVSPLLLIVAMYPISQYIDEQPHLDKKVAIYLLTVFIIFLFNYGSIMMWYTFDTCPFVIHGGSDVL